MKIIWLLFLLPLPLGYLLDLLLGDPAWLYHPVRFMGRCITDFEELLRRAFPRTALGETGAGILLASMLPLAFLGAAGVGMLCAWMLHPALWFALDTMLCYQLLAVRDLHQQSMAVYSRLAAGDTPGARGALSRIVGRDTAELEPDAIARAAVETVAENTCDGVVAPMLCLALGGGVLGLWYKAVNTLDSMVGYKNARYIHFGRASALLDDWANYLPARISAGLMLLATGPAGLDTAGAKRIYRRDRRCHQSPNSAHTESVCAGALGIQLGGDSLYGGKVVFKPTIGDAVRPVEAEDIPRANRLMLLTSAAGLLLCCSLRMLVILAFFG